MRFAGPAAELHRVESSADADIYLKSQPAVPVGSDAADDAKSGVVADAIQLLMVMVAGWAR